MSDNPCPFCGEQLEKLIGETSGLYSHYGLIDEKLPCEAHIFFPRGEHICERFERRDGASKETCPFCNSGVELTKTEEGDALVKCTNIKCEATINFGWLAFITRDKQPKYTAEETLELFRKRLSNSKTALNGAVRTIH